MGVRTCGCACLCVCVYKIIELTRFGERGFTNLFDSLVEGRVEKILGSLGVGTTADHINMSNYFDVL